MVVFDSTIVAYLLSVLFLVIILVGLWISSKLTGISMIKMALFLMVLAVSLYVAGYIMTNL